MGVRSSTVITPENQYNASPFYGVPLSMALIEKYLDSLQKNGCTPETRDSYRAKLVQLYNHLPSDKHIQAGTLEAWRDALAEMGYSNSTINTYTSAANGLMAYCGRREFQVEKQLKRETPIQPELTRNEYLRLLAAARALDKQREYLLVKVFGTTGLSLHELPQLTVETVQVGKIMFPSTVLRIPDCLRCELLDYIKSQGLLTGPVFVTRCGKPIGRNNVTVMIQSLCRDARVPTNKATPKCLKKLYQTTQDGIQANIALLVEQAHDRLLETEQLAIGWTQNLDEQWKGGNDIGQKSQFNRAAVRASNGVGAPE